MAKALTIAGSDTSSGAGIQADLRVFSSLHVYGTSVITALTAQNTRGILRIKTIEPEMIRAQIKAVLSDIEIDAIKIGMVYNKEIIKSIAKALKSRSMPIVLDPIFKAGSGATLLRDDALPLFIKLFVPMATIITPNVMEAERLAKMKIHSVEDSKVAAEEIARLGAENVIIKGGHMKGSISTDILLHRKKFFEFTNEKIKGRCLHGAGCSFSAALTAQIAKRMNVVVATKKANEYAKNAILNAQKIGKGDSVPSFELLASSNNLIQTLQKAVDMIEATDNFGTLIPESQSNIVYAKATAKSIDDIAAVKGRIVKIGKKAKAASSIDFGASTHVASALLALMPRDKSVRSAMNIKYDEKIITICETLGFKVSSYDRREEPEQVKSMDGMTVKWGIEQAVSKVNGVPDVVYHLGDWGKEPMILIFGKNPSEVSNRAISILNRLK